MKKIIGLCVFLILMGCNNEEQEDDIQFTENLEINPEMLGFQTYELGELIKNLMPDIKKDKMLEIWNWDHLANDQKIKWTTEGYKEEYDTYLSANKSYRDGLIRIHQSGERVSTLKDRKYEVPWLIRYEGDMPKFGVTLITLDPSKDEILTFPDPVPSLKKQRIKITTICSKKLSSGEINVYLLEATKKQPVYLGDHISGGSGGESRWLDLSLKDVSHEWCNKF